MPKDKKKEYVDVALCGSGNTALVNDRFLHNLATELS